MGGNGSLHLSQLPVARNRICFSQVYDRMQAVIAVARAPVFHPEPTQRGEGPRSCNPRSPIGNDRSSPIVRSHRPASVRDYKKCFPRLVIGALARTRCAFSVARPRAQSIHFCIALACWLNLRLYDRTGSPCGRRARPEQDPGTRSSTRGCAGMRYKIDSNHDIFIWNSMNRPSPCAKLAAFF